MEEDDRARGGGPSSAPARSSPRSSLRTHIRSSDPTKVVVAFLDQEVELGSSLELGDLGPYLPDELTLHGREIYVSVPNGQGSVEAAAEVLVKRRLPLSADGAELVDGGGAGGDDVPPRRG